LLIPGAELRELRLDQLDADLISMEEWSPSAKLATVVIQFFSESAQEKGRRRWRLSPSCEKRMMCSCSLLERLPE